MVIGENETFVGGERYLKERGIEVVVFQNEECKTLMQKFIEEKPQVWYDAPSPIADRCILRLYLIGAKTLVYSRVLCHYAS